MLNHEIKLFEKGIDLSMVCANIRYISYNKPFTNILYDLCVDARSESFKTFKSSPFDIYKAFDSASRLSKA